MKIRFLSGPNAGKVDHAPIHSQEIELLIKAGIVEVLHEAPPAPLPVSFGIIFGYKNAGATLQANCPTCHRTDLYVGKPDRETIASNFLRFLCVHFKGVEVPEQQRAAYSQAWRPVPGIAGINVLSKNTLDSAPHWVEKDGAIVPTPAPKGWDAWKKIGPK
jgi:hypothetical protein